MAEQRQRRHRATSVRRSDPRVAGYYEQCGDDAPGRDDRARLAATVGSLAGLEVAGRCGRTGRLSFGELRALAGSDRLSDFDVRTIELVDLLTRVELSAEAEVIVLDTLDHGRRTVRIDRALRDGDTRLVLGGVVPSDGRPLEPPVWSDPIVLETSQIATERPIRVVAATALTHGEFLDAGG
ncbi:hypothetical protein [Ilumatobacter sp.]|uniref:hypothetical protein n=1 Tax=Ilumatobacter sp. TaxID=1967498 RepID=UPI003B52A126